MALGEIRCGVCGQEILGPHACSPSMTWFRWPDGMYAPPVRMDLDEGSVDDAFLAKARVTMKKCQVGTNSLAYAHDILAECYGTIGRLITLTEDRQSEGERTANAA